MAARCLVCETPLVAGTPVVRVSALAETSRVEEVAFQTELEGQAFLCCSHEGVVGALRALLPGGTEDAESELRGRLYQDLDLLAFALEMEASQAASRTDGEEDADRAQLIRLGVRLAQRLVSGVFAPEVDPRLARWRAEYQARFSR